MGRGKAYFWHACQIEEVHMYSDLLNLALCWQANLVIDLTNEPCISFSISAGIFISTEGLYFLLICFVDFMFVHTTAISGDNPSISSKCKGADWTSSCSSARSLRRCDNSYKVPPDTSVSFNFELTLLGWGERVKILPGSKVKTSRNLRVIANF